MAKVTSVRLEDDLLERIEALADSLDRSKAWVIEQAIKSYVEEQAWQVEAINEALADYRSGNAKLVSHEQVEGEIEQLEADIRADLRP